MRARALAVEGASVFTPDVFDDPRGVFASPFQGSAFEDAVGESLFPVVQASTSTSRRGVVRGVHYTLSAASMAKYAFCTGGRALDVVVDLRVGSPTFGASDSVELSPETFSAVYLPPRVGHLFVALEEQTTMVYLLSAGYAAEYERAVHPLDPALGLSLPGDLKPILSERDTDAPDLAAARSQGLLPDYEPVQADR